MYFTDRPSQNRNFARKLNSTAQFLGASKNVLDLVHAVNIRKQREETAERIEEGSASGKLQKSELGGEEEKQALLSGNLFVGAREGVLQMYDGELSMVTMGGPGSGKSSRVSLPNIIHSGGRRSTVINCVNGQASWMTCPGRKILDGQEPILLNFWGMHGWRSDYYNPLQRVIDAARKGQPVNDMVKATMGLLHGNLERHGQNAWLYRQGKTLGDIETIFNAHEEPENCTFGNIWDLSTSTMDQMKDRLNAMTLSDAGEGYVARKAAQLLDGYQHESAAEHLSWVTESLEETFALYAPGSPLREFTSKTTIDVSRLKKRPQALYIMTPDKYAVSHARHTALMFDCLIEELAEAEGECKILFELDEFAQLPRMNSILTCLRLYRDRGLRLNIHVQDPDGFSQYKDDGGYAAFQNLTIGLTLGVRNVSHMKDMQERAGYDAVRVATSNIGSGGLSGQWGMGESEMVTPILPVSKIAQMKPGQAILEIPGFRTMMIDTVPWWLIEPWRQYMVNNRTHPVPRFK